MDYTERLRRLAINDAEANRDVAALADDAGALDPRTRALVQMAALIAAGGEVPSYGAQADVAVSAGATVAEIVDVLFAVVPIVGMPCVVSAAPRLALALGYDTEAGIEHQSGG